MPVNCQLMFYIEIMRCRDVCFKKTPNEKEWMLELPSPWQMEQEITQFREQEKFNQIGVVLIQIEILSPSYENLGPHSKLGISRQQQLNIKPNMRSL